MSDSVQPSGDARHENMEKTDNDCNDTQKRSFFDHFSSEPNKNKEKRLVSKPFRSASNYIIHQSSQNPLEDNTDGRIIRKPIIQYSSRGRGKWAQFNPLSPFVRYGNTNYAYFTPIPVIQSSIKGIYPYGISYDNSNGMTNFIPYSIMSPYNDHIQSRRMNLHQGLVSFP
ncbi:unnamed protein product [Trichobilharzia regenti]|nr:unnamed protein product [Trichobilharzia regenti]